MNSRKFAYKILHKRRLLGCLVPLSTGPNERVHRRGGPSLFTNLTLCLKRGTLFLGTSKEAR